MQPCTEVDVLIQARHPSDLPRSVATGYQDRLAVGEWFHGWQPIPRLESGTTAIICVVHDNSDIHDFRQRVAGIPGVSAVLAETGPSRERHITTFVSQLSEDVEEKIYSAEAQIIEKYQNRVFDFHLRLTPTDQQGNPQLPGGPFYLLTWQAK